MDFKELSSLGFEPLSKVFSKTGKYLEDVKNGKIKYYKTSWERTNKILGGGFQKSTIYTIAGRPSIGKSAYVNRIIFDICNLNDVSNLLILYWNWEMPNYQQVIREMSNKISKSVQDIKNLNLANEEINALKELKSYMLKPIWMIDKSKNIEFINKTCRNIQAIYPSYQIINVFDHTRLVSDSGKQYEYEESKIKDFYAMSRDLSVEFEFINIFLSQLNRNIESESRLKNPIPILSDLFGADAVGQFSNTVIILQRPEMYFNYGLNRYLEFQGESLKNLLIAHVVKNRDGEIGYIDYVHNLKFNQIKEK